MTTEMIYPKFHIWIEGIPRSSQKNKKSLDRYVESIRIAAREVIDEPMSSKRIDVEIFFMSDRSLRADVDNVIKPVLDALSGIAYHDDRQVRSVRATALPENEATGLRGWISTKTWERLQSPKKREFLIIIFDDFFTQGPGLDPKVRKSPSR